jgi:hypothetical protein
MKTPVGYVIAHAKAQTPLYVIVEKATGSFWTPPDTPPVHNDLGPEYLIVDGGAILTYRTQDAAKTAIVKHRLLGNYRAQIAFVGQPN